MTSRYCSRPTLRAVSTPRDVHDRAGHHVGLEVVAEGAFAVGLGDHRDAIAGDLNEQMVELVAVDGAVLAGRQPQLPHTDMLVLEHHAAADVTQHTVVSALGHGCTLRHRWRTSPGELIDRVLQLS